MNFFRKMRVVLVGLAFLLGSGLFMSFVLAQGSNQVRTDWYKVREIFDAYFSSPTDDSAHKVLAALPSRVDDKITNFSAMNASIERIYNDHIVALDELVSKGNRLALRIAFNFRKFTDGWYSENVTGVIGDSIVPMAAIFLEETLLFRKNNPREIGDHRFYTSDDFLDQVLCGYIDFDNFRPEIVRKEINARIKALAEVDRTDLRELRDDCLERLKNHLKKIRVDVLNRSIHSAE